MVLKSFRVLFGVWNPVAKMYAPLMNWLKISHDYFMLGQVVGIYKKNYIFFVIARVLTSLKPKENTLD